MLPLGMLKSAQKQSILVEVKSGETFNGTLVNCDVWMNLHLEDVIKTSSDGEHFFALQEALIKGSTIKYIRLPDDVVSIALEYNKRQQNIRRQNRDLNQSSHRSSGKKIHRGGNSQKAGVPQGIAAAENPRKH